MFIRVGAEGLVVLNVAMISRIETLDPHEYGDHYWRVSSAGTEKSIYVRRDDYENIMKLIEKTQGLM